MTNRIDPKTVFNKPLDVIVRDIEDELVIITMTSGISDLDSTVYSLNQTGKAFWQLIDGQLTLEDIIVILSKDYNISLEKIQKEILELIQNLLDNGLIFETKAEE
jgi:hypothetical protein